MKFSSNPKCPTNQSKSSKVIPPWLFLVQGLRVGKFYHVGWHRYELILPIGWQEDNVTRCHREKASSAFVILRVCDSLLDDDSLQAAEQCYLETSWSFRGQSWVWAGEEALRKIGAGRACNSVKGYSKEIYVNVYLFRTGITPTGRLRAIFETGCLVMAAGL